MKRRIIVLTALLLALSPGALARDREKIVRYDDPRPVVAPKGSFLIGGSASFDGHTNDNYDFAIVKGINSVGYNIAASPEFCYFFSDNLGVGARVGYGRNMIDISSARAELTSLSMGLEYYYLESRNINTMVFLRYYLPVADSKRIAFHVDAGLGARFAQSKNSEEHTGAVVGTWENNNRFGLYVNPGVTAFLSNRVALFASVGMAGISYSRKSQIHNQVYNGKAGSFAISYLVDVSALSIGIDIFLGKR